MRVEARNREKLASLLARHALVLADTCDSYFRSIRTPLDLKEVFVLCLQQVPNV